MTEAKKTVYLPIPISCRDVVIAALVERAVAGLRAWQNPEKMVGIERDFIAEAAEALNTALELRKS